MAEQIEFDQAHLTLQEITEALDNGRFVHVRRQLQDMEPEDIAHLLEASPRKAREVLWQLTDPEDYGEILDELNEDVKDALVSKMAPEKLAEATEGMDIDDVAYVLRSLPDDVSREVLSQMDAADRMRVETALSYPEDTMRRSDEHRRDHHPCRCGRRRCTALFTYERRTPRSHRCAVCD